MWRVTNNGACLFAFFFLQGVLSTFDINKRQLQMVADSLKLDECRKLAESLHKDGFERDHEPDGKSEPKGVSCLRLLEHWNTHEGKDQTFHLLALRLQQLGHHDLADQLSLSVSDEKVDVVKHKFLDDPFKDKIQTNSPLLEESPHVAQEEKEKPEESPPWTWFEIFEAIGLIIIFIVFLFIAFLTFLRCFLPDSFARMRASLYVAFTGKRAGAEELFFIM